MSRSSRGRADLPEGVHAMRRAMIVLVGFAAVLFSGVSDVAGKDSYVRGYYRKDGTYVRPIYGRRRIRTGPTTMGALTTTLSESAHESVTTIGMGYRITWTRMIITTTSPIGTIPLPIDCAKSTDDHPFKNGRVLFVPNPKRKGFSLARGTQRRERCSVSRAV